MRRKFTSSFHHVSIVTNMTIKQVHIHGTDLIYVPIVPKQAIGKMSVEHNNPDVSTVTVVTEP